MCPCWGRELGAGYHNDGVGGGGERVLLVFRGAGGQGLPDNQRRQADSTSCSNTSEKM